MNHLKVSIITLTYNHESYIQKCITSVLEQTYTNWEMIIIDDHSSDKTVKIIREYARRDSRIKFFSHKKNWGITKLVNSYNQALALASGQLIAILEGDDFWPQEKLMTQVKSFNDKNVVLSYGDCITVNTANTPLYIRYYSQKKSLLNNTPSGSIVSLMMNLNFFIIPSTILIKKTTLTSLGGFIKTKDYPFIDIPTILELSLKGKFHYTKKITGYYRKHVDSSWFAYIIKDTHIMRSAIKISLIRFIGENRNNFYSLLENIEEIKQHQEKILNHYKKQRKLYIFIRFFRL